MTLGTITHHVPGAPARPYWSITAQPHVTTMLKRVLPRVRSTRTGAVEVVDTPQIAADLAWFRQRYPLDLDPIAGQHLEQRVTAYQRKQQEVKDVLAGGGTLTVPGVEPLRPLRDYQLVALAMMRASGRMILGDDAGLGKTLESLALLGDPGTLPALVVCQTHLPRQWLRELAETWPLLLGHIVRGTKPYDLTDLRGSRGYAPDVIICPYSRVHGWADHLAKNVRTVILDECQELRNGTDTGKGTAVAQIADAADYVIGCSATPVYNYANEIHSIFSIIAPDRLGTSDEFRREWRAVDLGNGKARIADPAALGTYLREEGLLLRRSRADVKREMRDPLRIRQEVESDPDAVEQAVSGTVAELARLILDKTTDQKSRFVAAGRLDAEVRQATGLAKAPYVAAFVKMLLESEQRIVLVGWHRSVYEVWLDLLAGYSPVLYTGSESPTQKRAAVDAFLHGDSRVLILSVRSGTGLDGLQHGCSVIVFGELDWSPAVHDQAMWRLDRDGQPDTVAAYFLVSDQGSDPPMDEVLQLKRSQAEPIRDPNAPLLAPMGDGGADHIERLAEAIVAQHDRSTAA